MSAEGSWSQLCLKHWCAAVDHPIGCMLPKGTKVDLSLRLPPVRQCTLSKTGLTSSISHTSALCLQNWSFCPMTFMFGLPLQLRGSMSCHFVCSLSITSCYLLLYSPSLVTVLLLHVKQCDESLPWYPCALLCQSFSFDLYHFWSLSSFITSLHSNFGFY